MADLDFRPRLKAALEQGIQELAKRPGRAGDMEENVELMYRKVLEALQCPGCAPTPEEKNHPPGMVFVGWGRGWESCPRCGGLGLSFG